LRDVHEFALTVVFLAVIAADDMAFLDPAFRQFGGAMAATVLERRRLALLVEKEDDVLPGTALGRPSSGRERASHTRSCAEPFAG
jgi:hypothetical protein